MFCWSAGIPRTAQTKPSGPVINGFPADVLTSEAGRWQARLPALATEMTVEAILAGHRLVEKVEVASAQDAHHVILTWNGPQTFHIHAEGLEHGKKPVFGAQARIGDAGMAAFEVFSNPIKSGQSGGVIRLAVDATLTKENCGRIASVTAYQTSYSGRLQPTEISYTMPDCERIGESLRLQNLFRDMRLAAR